MKKTVFSITGLTALCAILVLIVFATRDPVPSRANGEKKKMEITLPAPDKNSETSVEQALESRRSTRSYKNQPLELSHIAQLLWAAQGITKANFYRTAPSPGALYPLEVYIAAANVKSLDPGIYRYRPSSHSLELVVQGNVLKRLSSAALGQGSVSAAPADIIITAVYHRVTGKYRQRGIRYTHMEAGHASQNIYLQCQSLGLGTVAIGAFDDDKVRQLVKADQDETPLYIMPVGHP